MTTPATPLLEWYEFSPLEDLKESDMIAIWKAVRLTLHDDAWQKLDENVKKHFIVKKRSGEAFRYGTTPRTSRRALNK